MAIEQTFRAIKAAADSGDFDSIGRIVESAKQAGYGEAEFKSAYKQWEKTGVSAEPNPLKQVAQGAQLGFTDELVGLGSAIGKSLAGDTRSFSENYRNRRDAERAANALSGSNHGSVALNMAGGLLVPVPGNFVAQGLTMPARATRGALLSIPYGTAAGAGFSEGETAGDVAVDAGIGGAISAVTGGLLTPAVEVLGRGGRAAIRAISDRGREAIPAAPPAPAIDSLSPDAAIPQVGPDAPVSAAASMSADEDIVKAMLRDGFTPEQIRDTLAQRAIDTAPRPTPMTVADVVPEGGATQRLARGARAVAPGAGGKADAMLAARDRMQGRRIEDAGASLLGSRMDDPEMAMQEITQRARDAARPLYQQVEQAGPVDIVGLESVRNTDAFKRAFRAVSGMPDMQGLGLDNPRFLDQIYKELGGMRQAMSDAARKSGNVNPRDISRLEMVMAPVREALDAASGGTYSKALGAYAGEAQFNSALEAGLDVFGKPAAAVAREINALPAEQANVYREAAMSAVRQRLRSMGYNRDAVKALFNSDEMVDKFSAILGPDRFKAFERAMLDEAKAVSTSQVLRGNSQTVDKVADAARAGGAFDVLRGAISDPGGTLTDSLLRAAVDRAGRLMPGAEARGDAILTRLLNTDTDANIAWLNQLIEAQKRIQAQQAGQGALLTPVLPAASSGLLSIGR